MRWWRRRTPLPRSRRAGAARRPVHAVSNANVTATSHRGCLRATIFIGAPEVTGCARRDHADSATTHHSAALGRERPAVYRRDQLADDHDARPRRDAALDRRPGRAGPIGIVVVGEPDTAVPTRSDACRTGEPTPGDRAGCHLVIVVARRGRGCGEHLSRRQVQSNASRRRTELTRVSSSVQVASSDPPKRTAAWPKARATRSLTSARYLPTEAKRAGEPWQSVVLQESAAVEPGTRSVPPPRRGHQPAGGTGRVGVSESPRSLSLLAMPGGPFTSPASAAPDETPTTATAQNTTASNRFTTIPPLALRRRRSDADRNILVPNRRDNARTYSTCGRSRIAQSSYLRVRGRLTRCVLAAAVC